MPSFPPPRWTDAQLGEGRAEAERRFTAQRREEGPNTFARVCGQVQPEVEAALDATDNLRHLTGEVFLQHPDAWQVFRYVCGPPISQEDLWTLVGNKFTRGVPPAYAEDTAEVLRLVIDSVRFPWLYEQRDPTAAELDAAILATTVLRAAQLLGTSRRAAASARQEDATAGALAAAGYDLDSSRDKITVLDQLARGTYSRERKIAGAKCDVPVRLRDGRLFAVECKVSNGPKNSWKRVNREVGGKAETWREQFGAQVLTAVVLAGVFDLSCLTTAQDRGVVLIWEHDLAPLTDFVASST